MGLLGLAPVAAGVSVLLDPLRRGKTGNDFIKITNLGAVPSDGSPRKFPVVSSKTDAWNKYPEVPIGAVYLRKTGDREVRAFNVICPHAGCFVDYQAKRNGYFCPCHNSTFALNGSIADPKSPSPRGLDSLEVEIRNGNEIWVKFQNFRAAIQEKVPTA